MHFLRQALCVLSLARWSGGSVANFPPGAWLRLVSAAGQAGAHSGILPFRCDLGQPNPLATGPGEELREARGTWVWHRHWTS